MLRNQFLNHNSLEHLESKEVGKTNKQTTNKPWPTFEEKPHRICWYFWLFKLIQVNSKQFLGIQGRCKIGNHVDHNENHTTNCAGINTSRPCDKCIGHSIDSSRGADCGHHHHQIISFTRDIGIDESSFSNHKGMFLFIPLQIFRLNAVYVWLTWFSISISIGNFSVFPSEYWNLNLTFRFLFEFSSRDNAKSIDLRIGIFCFFGYLHF